MKPSVTLGILTYSHWPVCLHPQRSHPHIFMWLCSCMLAKLFFPKSFFCFQIRLFFEKYPHTCGQSLRICAAQPACECLMEAGDETSQLIAVVTVWLSRREHKRGGCWLIKVAKRTSVKKWTSCVQWRHKCINWQVLLERRRTVAALLLCATAASGQVYSW